MYKVSIVIPNFNKEAFIYETLKSIMNQSYNNWECIIVDDCSKDKSVSIINDFVRDDKRFAIVEIKGDSKGGSYCRNIGLKQATGTYIMFLDSDDLLTNDCLKNRVEIMDKKPWLDFAVFTMGVFVRKIGDNNSQWFPQRKNPLGDFLEHKLPWSIVQPIWKKSLVESVNGFDIEFERLQDVEFHTRILFIEGIKFECFNSIPDCYYRIDETRINFNQYEFFSRWVRSAIKYFNKFYDLSSQKKMEKRLIGTIFKTYLSILNAYKLKKIDKDQFTLLNNKLIGPVEKLNFIKLKKICLYTARIFTLLPFRIKGVNWIIYRVLLIN